MDMLWGSFRRQANAGDLTLFRKLQAPVTELAKRMYGETQVGRVRYGRLAETAYILIELTCEPDGAKGPAND